MNMIQNVFFVAIAIASVSILWRKMLNDLPSLKNWIHANIPYPVNQGLTCGFCFTYWASLLGVMVFNPLYPWQPPLRFSPSPLYAEAIHFLSSWMIVGFAAVAIRYLFVVIQELVDYQMYTLNREFHDPEKEHSHEPPRTG